MQVELDVKYLQVETDIQSSNSVVEDMQGGFVSFKESECVSDSL